MRSNYRYVVLNRLVAQGKVIRQGKGYFGKEEADRNGNGELVAGR